MSRLDHNRGLNKTCDRHSSRIRSLDYLEEFTALNLPLQDGDKRRSIDHHQRGRPASSYPRISSARLLSSTGKLAQCSAISSSSSARRRLVRSRRTRASRSRRAFVTASVLLSPVCLASSASSRSSGLACSYPKRRRIKRRTPRLTSSRRLAYGAVRSFATKAACVTGICSAKNSSTASAYRRISRWAVSAARSETKFISARALIVQ